MIILTLRTDNPKAEIGLFNDEAQLAYETWEAQRELAATLHAKIKALLEGQGKAYSDVEGLVCYEGPGSFTGLRIGITVADAFAYSFSKPIVAAGGDDWAQAGIKRLLAGENDRIALPNYGAPAHVTQPRS
jgi:tRNA threonylcarbamoyladenosine biosynthesis protein TsaB